MLDTLKISEDEAVLAAPQIWGILRGLETFTQLIFLEDDVVWFFKIYLVS